MSQARIGPLACVLLGAITACAAPGLEPELTPTPSAGISTARPLPPEFTSTVTRTPSPPPSATSSPPPTSLGFPYLPADVKPQFAKLEMVDSREGWAIASEEEIAHVLKTEDGGSTWMDVTPPIELVQTEELIRLNSRAAAEFIDGDRAWASFGSSTGRSFDSIWRTSDGGRSWERVPLGRRNVGEAGMILHSVDPEHGWAVIDVFHGAGSHSGEAFRTLDGGASWERVLDDFGNASGVDFVDAQLGWVSTDVFAGVSPPWRLMITRDGGGTWTSVSPSGDAQISEPITGHSQCDFILLRAESARSGVAHRPDCRTQDAKGNLVTTSWLDFTNDGGRTWAFHQIPGGTPEFINSNKGWLIGPTELELASQPEEWALYATDDGGRTWQTLRPMDWHGELDFIDELNGWGLDENGRLWRTRDGGITWERLAGRTVEAAEPRDLTMGLELPADPIQVTDANVGQLELLATLPAADPTSLVMYRDRLFVGTAQGQVLSWGLAGPTTAKPGVWLAHSDWIYDLAATTNGGDLLSASRDGLVRRWHLFAADGFWDQSSIHDGEVSAVAIAPDGSTLASSGEDGVVWVHETFGRQGPEGRLGLRGHQAWVWDLAFSPDGQRLASASADRTVRVWLTATGEQTALFGGHASTVAQVRFSPNGAQLASATRDGEVWLWDLATDQVLTILEQHDDWVLGLAYSPDGSLLATASTDGSVLLWDPRAQVLLTELVDLDIPIRAVSFDWQGRFLAAVADDNRVYIWGIPGQ